MIDINSLSSEMRDIISHAFPVASKNGSKSLEPEHILYYIIDKECPDFVINRNDILIQLTALMQKLNNKSEKTENVSPKVISILNATASFQEKFNKKHIDINLWVYAMSKVYSVVDIKINEKKAETMLNKEDPKMTTTYLTNINEFVVKNDVMIIGGEEKIREISRIMQRKHKHCPILIGFPGVGKTSLLYALADRINHKSVSESLENKTIYMLNTSDILVNSTDKGEMVKKVKDMTAFINNTPNIILVVDEIHSLFQSSEGIYLMNFIKQFIEDKDMIVVGMTTEDKYKKYIKTDTSLERVFQSVKIDPATKEETLTILRGIQVQYEKYHKLEITDEALQFIVEITAKFMPDRAFPDKAIDVLDEACALVKMMLNSKPQQLEELQAKLNALKLQNLSTDKNQTAVLEQIGKIEAKIDQTNTEWLREKALFFGTAQLKEKIENAETELKSAVERNDFTTAIKLQAEELPKLKQELATVEADLLNIKENEKTMIFLKNTVGQEDVAEILSKRTGVPVNKLQQEEKTKLLQMPEILSASVINQDEAIAVISQAIQISKSGLAEDNKPMGSFMFLGSSGTGKTELAKALNQFLFEKKDSLIRLDMSEYMEKHAVSKLLGSPPGYAGCDEGGLLTEQIKKKPYSVVLFDEIEKAHPDIFNILLPLLDEGFITDSMGEIVDCRNTVIILTTNLGAVHIINHIKDPETMTWEHAKNNVLDETRKYFKPELLNRFDSLIVFNTLNKEAVAKIAEIQFKKLGERLASKELGLKIDQSAKDYLCDKGFDPVNGARPLKRTLKDCVDSQLALDMLKGKFKPNSTIHISCENNELTFNAIESA